MNVFENGPMPTNPTKTVFDLIVLTRARSGGG